MTSFLHSSSTCWAILVRDYGLWGTVSTSAASILLVLVLAMALHRTFLSSTYRSSSSRAQRQQQLLDNNKQRKQRNGATKSKGQQPVTTLQPSDSSSATTPTFLRTTSGEVGGSPTCSGNTGPELAVHRGASPNDESDLNRKTSTETTKDQPDDDNVDVVEDTLPPLAPAVSQDEAPSVLESIVSTEETTAGFPNDQPRVPSVCTVDSSVLSSDEISCESISVILPQTAKSRSNNSNNNNQRRGKNNRSKRGGRKSPPNLPKSNSSSNNNNNNNNSTKTSPITKTTDLYETQSTTKSKKATTHHAKNEKHEDHSEKQAGKEKHAFVNNKGRGDGHGHNNKHHNSNGGRGHNIHGHGKGGRYQQNASPRKTPMNGKQHGSATARNSLPPVASSFHKHVPVSPTGSRSSYKGYNKNGRATPVSPATKSLASCEAGASGWTMPMQPTFRPVSASPDHTKAPAISYRTNESSFVTSYSQVPAADLGGGYPSPNPSVAALSDTSGSIDSSCRLWESAPLPYSSSYGNSITSTPQRTPVHAPPGFAPSPANGLGTPSSLLSTSGMPYTPSMYMAPVRPANGAGATPSSFAPTSSPFGTPAVSPMNVAALSFSSWNDDSNRGGIGGYYQNPSTKSPRSGRIKENPFASDDSNGYYSTSTSTNAAGNEEADSRIEAELQELGGQMVGSVLDF